MKDHIIEKAKQIAVKAKNNSDNAYHGQKVTLKSGGRDSLSDVIKTPEQAKLFMTLLKSF
jgi:hypothetical protein